MPPAPPLPDGEENLEVMSFGEHLEELRHRIIRSLLVTLLFTIVALIFQSTLMEMISAPHRRAMRQVQGRRLADEVAERLLELRREVAALPAEEGARAIAEEERRARAIRLLRSEIRDPQVQALADLVLEGEEASITGTGLSGWIERIEIDLAAAAEDHAWGAQAPIVEAREDLAGLGEAVSGWREQAAPAAGTPPDGDGVSTVRRLDRELEGVAGRTERLRLWREEEVPLRLLSYVEAFFAHLKLVLLTGFLIGLPWITHEIWLFIAAGLYRHERSAVAPYLPFSLLSLVAGGLFAYKILIPVGLSYLGGYGDPDVFEPTFTLSNYMGLVFTLLIGMGLVFQLPLLMIFLSRAGLVTPERFREVRKYSILCAFVFGACLTPPDVVTQLLMAGPLVLLYETGILASVWFRRRAERRAREGGVGSSGAGE